MSFGSRLRARREELGMKQSDLGTLLGVTGSAIGNYENGISSPRADILCRVFDVLKCDANYLFQDEMSELDADNITVPEIRMIKKYRSLDVPGQEAVDLILDCEARRMDAAKEKPEPVKEKPPMKVIPLFGASFAAGLGEPDFGNAWEDYEVEANSKADFAIRINGDSMEPYLADGSIALGIKCAPRDGEVAALLLDGEFLCKQVCQDATGNLYLFALNRTRKDADQTIWHDSERSVSCFGTIIMDRVPLPADV